MRPIDGDALFDRVETLSKDAGFYKPIYQGFQSLISNAPTIEAEPVVHGEWIPHDRMTISPLVKNYACSNCGVDGHRTNYCPNCGAKMKAGDQNE